MFAKAESIGCSLLPGIKDPVDDAAIATAFAGLARRTVPTGWLRSRSNSTRISLLVPIVLTGAWLRA